MINCNLFYCKNKDTYPPFKNGLYLEEYFLKTFCEQNPSLKGNTYQPFGQIFRLKGGFNHTN